MSNPGPPSYHVIGKHAAMPVANHDEIARFNYLANFNRFLSTQVMPSVKISYDRRAKPAFEAQNQRGPQTRHEVRKLMSTDRAFQNWSALRRSTMELRQQAGRSLVLRQRDELVSRAAKLNHNAQLKIDPEFVVPRYIKNVDQHCMPGGYVQETLVGDVSAAANYDAGIFATTGGGLGRYSDGGGWAVVNWLETEHKGFEPKRILDVGCGLGHNTLPLAQAFPRAEIVAIDVAAPMLRYGSARAQSLGIRQVKFEQVNAECLPYSDDSFDLVMTCMFLHETSHSAIQKIFGEIHRVQAPGGLSLHLEQPQYAGMDVFEQFIRDWDAYNNNEPFWTTMHDLDLRELAVRAGARSDQCFETGLSAVVDENLFPKSKEGTEDYGRKAVWYAFGTKK
jgi:SAM-dependent methyltransferase